MKKSSCELLLTGLPRISEFEELRSTYFPNSIFNSFLSYTAIMLNIVTIHAIRKTSSLPRTLKPLLLSLAVSDVGVGLVGQPFYTSLLIKWLQQNDPGCNTYMVFNVIMGVFATASFLGVVAVSVDRFLAIHLYLRYQELVTRKRVIAVIILIWVTSVFLSLMTLWVSSSIRNLISVTLSVVGLLLTTVVYIRIYLAVRRHKNQIQLLQAQHAARTGEMTDFCSLMKSAVSGFYVYLAYLVCFLPYLISATIFKIYGPSITWKRCALFSFTLVFLDSSLNPVIYCWKMRHIRHAITEILRNMSCRRNRDSLILAEARNTARIIASYLTTK